MFGLRSVTVPLVVTPVYRKHSAPLFSCVATPPILHGTLCDVARTCVPLGGFFVCGTEMALLFGELDLPNQLHYKFWFDLVRKAVDANAAEVEHREELKRQEEAYFEREMEFFKRVVAEHEARERAERERRWGRGGWGGGLPYQ